MRMHFASILAAMAALLAYPACAVEVNLEVEQRLIQEFGQEKTEIRDGAILIMNGAYAPEPYIVERRGLNLYLNGQPISTPWEYWPIPDPELIEENPSEPPNGGNPITFYKPETKCEAAHAFWNAKEMYYIQHFPKEEATRRLVADLEKASQREDADWKVRYNPAYFHEGCFDIVSADGEAISWGLGDWPPPPKPTNEELLQDIRGKYESEVRDLKSRHYYISVTKGDSGLTQFSEPFLMIFDLMMTDLPYEQRLEKAKQSGYKDWEGYYPNLLRTIEPAPELLAKIARIRADFEKKSKTDCQKHNPPNHKTEEAPASPSLGFTVLRVWGFCLSSSTMRRWFRRALCMAMQWKPAGFPHDEGKRMNKYSTILLLIGSNCFMTYAWYGHLRDMRGKAIFVAVMVSWGVAFFEYCLQVPANRIGHEFYSLGQLKVMQEVITMCVFAVFAVVYMREPLKLDYLWAGCCLAGAAYFMFRGMPSTV